MSEHRMFEETTGCRWIQVKAIDSRYIDDPQPIRLDNRNGLSVKLKPGIDIPERDECVQMKLDDSGDAVTYLVRDVVYGHMLVEEVSYADEGHAGAVCERLRDRCSALNRSGSGSRPDMQVRTPSTRTTKLSEPRPQP